MLKSAAEDSDWQRMSLLSASNIRRFKHLDLLLCILGFLIAPLSTAWSAGLSIEAIRATHLSDVADPGLRKTLTDAGMRPVDLNRWPEFSGLLDRVSGMVGKLADPKLDGDRPIQVMLVDDLNVNAAFIQLDHGNGPRVVAVNLGLLKYAKSDDEVAFVIAHELEHGLSQIGEYTDKLRADAKATGDTSKVLTAALVGKSEESEVDTKSIFRRLVDKGYNPYHAEKLLARMESDFGNGSGMSHPTNAIRKNVLSAALTAFTRGLGREIDSNRFSDTIVKAADASLDSPAYRDARAAEIKKLLVEPVSSFDEVLEKIARDQIDDSLWRDLGIDLKDSYRSPVSAERREFYRRLKRVREVADGILDEAGINDFELILKRHFIDQYLKARSRYPDLKPRSAGQALALAALEKRDVIPSFVGKGQDLALKDAALKIHELEEEKAEALRDARSGHAEAERSRSLIAKLDQNLAKARQELEVAKKAYRPEMRARVDEIADEMAEIWWTVRGNMRMPEKHIELERELQTYLKHLPEDKNLFDVRRRQALIEAAKTIDFDLKQMPIIEAFLNDYGNLISTEERRELVAAMAEKLRSSVQREIVSADTPEKRMELLSKVQKIENELFWKARGRDPVLGPDDLGLAFGHAKWMSRTFAEKATSPQELEKYYPTGSREIYEREKALFRMSPEHGFLVDFHSRNYFLDPKFLEDHAKRVLSLGLAQDLGSLSSPDFMGVLEKQARNLLDFSSDIKTVESRLSGDPQGKLKDAKDAAESLRKKFYEETKKIFRERFFSGLPQRVQERYVESLFSTAFTDLREMIGPIDRSVVIQDLAAMAKNPDLVKRVGKVVHLMDAFHLDPARGPDYLLSLKPILSPKPSLQPTQAVETHSAMLELAGHLKYSHPDDLGLIGGMLNENPFEALGPDQSFKIYSRWTNPLRERTLQFFLQGQGRTPLNELKRDQIAQGIEKWAKTFGYQGLSYLWTGGNSSKPLVELGREIDDPFEMIIGYLQGSKSALTQLEKGAQGAEKESLRKALTDPAWAFGEKIRDFEGSLRSDSSKSDAYLRTKSPLQIAEYLDLTAASMKNPSELRDLLFEEAWKGLGQDPRVAEHLKNPALVKGLKYADNRDRLAQWQLDQRIRLSSRGWNLRAGRTQAPDKAQVRNVIRDAKKAIDEIFPDQSVEKSKLIERVEAQLQTSQAESAFLAPSRLNSENWVQHRGLAAIDLPSDLRYLMKSQYDRVELADYLVGLSDELPVFIQKETKGEAYRREWFLRELASIRRKLDQADIFTRSFMIQSLLNSEEGAFSDPALRERLYTNILGKYQKDPLLRVLFESYLESVPDVEKKAIVSYIYASLAGQQAGSKGVSIRSILEAMGPFGIKAGQFLRSSGKLSPELARELDDFFHFALPPTRPMIYADLERFFGPGLTDISEVHQLIGAGSINYTVRARMPGADGKPKPVVIRLRREQAFGQIQNENRNWESAIQKLKAHSNPDARQLANVLEEARLGAMDTLKPGGVELNLGYERDQHSSADRAYSAPKDGESGLRIEVGKPLLEYQRRIPAEFQDAVSIYEYVPSVDFKDLSDGERRAISKQILGAELKAIFEKGTFDPDGHIGNWLVDKEHGRLVRIDYAQLRTLDPGKMQLFKDIMGRMFLPKLEGQDHRALAEAFSGIFDLPPGSRIDENRLLELIKQVSDRSDFPAFNEPHQRLLFLRQHLESALQKSLGPEFVISLKPETRAVLSSMGRMLYYRDFMTFEDFSAIFAKHMDLPMGRISKQLLTMKLGQAASKFLGRDKASEGKPSLNPALQTAIDSFSIQDCMSRFRKLGSGK